MKKNYLNELKDIQGMVNRVRTLKESISFGDEYDENGGEGYEDFGGEGEEQSMPVGKMEAPASAQQPKQPESEGDIEKETMDQMTEIDQIREITLKGMMKLCHNTEDPQYEVLKKIFTFCDKANDKKDEQQPVK